MKRLLSKYSLRYPRSIVYMLQASEYKILDFWHWFRKVADFGEVEKRKNLVFTLKAKILIFIAYCGYAPFFILSFNHLIFANYYWNYVFAVIFFLLAPIVCLLLTVTACFLLNIIQKPIESRIKNKAREKLKNHKATKIAIAGSFGKTTMKEILSTVLGTSKKVASTVGNNNTPIGIARFVNGLSGDEEVLVFEMGEYYKGDITELCEIIDPDIGVITGVNEAHLSKFKNIAITGNTIFELSDWLNNKGRGILFVNADNLRAIDVLKSKNTENIEVITYGKFGTPNFRAESVETDLNGTHFNLRAVDGSSIIVRSGLLGEHQVGPLSVGANIGFKLNMKLADIELGLKNTKPFNHRLEPREEAGGVVVIDDSYNGNPDGVRAAINFLSNIKNKRRFYITPGLVEMGDSSEEIHVEIGRLLAVSNIEKVVLIKNSVTHFIEKGLKNYNYGGEIIWFDDALTAFRQLPNMTVANDCLLYQNDWPDNYN